MIEYLDGHAPLHYQEHAHKGAIGLYARRDYLSNCHVLISLNQHRTLHVQTLQVGFSPHSLRMS